MQKLFKFAQLYSLAASSNTHRWAANIVYKAFKQVMGRAPTPAELQITMAVASLETGYGTGWGKGQSTSGQGSHNWGGVQSNKGFSHQDSSAKGKYNTKFKLYTDDISGAADVVSLLFKNGHKQHEPNPNDYFRANGPVISGPTRSEIIEESTQQGDITLFSKGMWYTGYYEGTAKNFVDRIKTHANGIQNKVNQIAASLGQPSAWSIKTDNYLPVTNDQTSLSRINSYITSSPIENIKPAEPKQKDITELTNQESTEPNIDELQRILWF